MAAAGALLLGSPGTVAVIVAEVQAAMYARGVSVHVRTGLTWTGLRGRDGTVEWTAARAPDGEADFLADLLAVAGGRP
jgi:hypothetical protein